MIAALFTTKWGLLCTAATVVLSAILVWGEFREREGKQQAFEEVNRAGDEARQRAWEAVDEAEDDIRDSDDGALDELLRRRGL